MSLNMMQLFRSWMNRTHTITIPSGNSDAERAAFSRRAFPVDRAFRATASPNATMPGVQARRVPGMTGPLVETRE